MANSPSNISFPWSPEQFAEVYRVPNACRKCGASEASESSGQRFMVCGGCEGPSYCSKDRQRADWPSHKADCKKQQALRAKHQAQGTGEISQQFEDCLKHRKTPITLMMMGMLGKEARTHVLRITVDHQPTKKPSFQAVDVKVVSLEELSACRPAMSDSIRSSMVKDSPSPEGMEVGRAIIDCPAIKYSTVLPGPVWVVVTQMTTPQDILNHLRILNMDANEALELMSKVKVPASELRRAGLA